MADIKYVDHVRNESEPQVFRTTVRHSRMVLYRSMKIRNVGYKHSQLPDKYSISIITQDA